MVYAHNSKSVLDLIQFDARDKHQAGNDRLEHQPSDYREAFRGATTRSVFQLSANLGCTTSRHKIANYE